MFDLLKARLGGTTSLANPTNIDQKRMFLDGVYGLHNTDDIARTWGLV